MKPKFELGAYSLQFSRGIKYPVEKPHERVQVWDRTGGGTLKREDLGITIRQKRLAFSSLPQADYDALVTWYDTIAAGLANPFTYYDEEGETFVVVMLSNPGDFKQTSYQRYAGEILLEVVE